MPDPSQPPRALPEPAAAPSSTRARPMAGSRWQVQLLGGFGVRNGDVGLGRFPSRHAQWLFARLAMAPGQPLRKEAICEWLWPEAPLQDARHNLRTVKSALANLLEPPGFARGSVLDGDRERVWLRAGAVRSDVAELKALEAAGAWSEALALYVGELLPATADRRFFDLQRERLAEVAAGLQEKLARRHAAQARPRLRRTAVAVTPAEVDRRLPAMGLDFVNRVVELGQLADAAATGRRLVVVVGPGGCGKTRLCVQAARTVGGFDFVGFASLADESGVDAIVERIRAVCDLQAGARSTLDQIVAHLETRRPLLILDNVEQFDRAATAGLVARLLERLPALHLWISSRVSIEAAEAFELPLEPLPLPGIDADPVAALRASSVVLFVDRARRARADFHLHARNVGAVVRLCRLLEGLPLAIELAAARVRQMPPAALVDAIEADWSAIARVGAPARQAGRHASIEQAIDWSLGLLAPGGRALLTAITSFEGGCTLAQAAAVYGSEADTGAGLRELVAASLLQAVVTAAGVPRWQMLRSVRDTVCKRASDDALRAARAACRAWFVRAAAAPATAADEASLTAAFAGALDDGDFGAAVALALGWQAHWGAVGMVPRAVDALARLAQRIADDASAEARTLADAERCRLLAGATPLLLAAGRTEAAQAAATAALQCAGESVESRARALIAHVNCFGRTVAPGDSMLAEAHEALDAARRVGNPVLQARALIEVGRCTLQLGDDPDAAERLFAEASALMRGAGDESGSLAALPGQLACLLRRKRWAESIAVAVAGLERAQRLGHAELTMLLFNRHGSALEGMRRRRQAIVVFQQQARAAVERGMAYHFAYAAWNQCAPLMGLRFEQRGIRLLAFATRYWTGHFAPLTADEQAAVDEARARVAERIGTSAEARAWREGLAWSVAEGQAVACGRPEPPRTGGA